MSVVEGGITEQTTQALKNLDQVIKASGSTINKVAKTTVRGGQVSRFASAHDPVTLHRSS
jgi:2-iminobutanoate/2-iminopropanoate deaminase